jgi:uncharacterized membrane protein
VYRWALFFHFVGALAFFAGLAVAAVGQAAARRRARPSEIALLLGVARSGVLLVGLGTLLVLGFGFWLVHLTGHGFEGWVIAALALLGISLVAGGIGGQAPKRARRLAVRLAEEGDESSPELGRLLRSPVADALNGAAAIAAIAILVLMVWKPGA